MIGIKVNKGGLYSFRELASELNVREKKCFVLYLLNVGGLYVIKVENTQLLQPLFSGKS